VETPAAGLAATPTLGAVAAVEPTATMESVAGAAATATVAPVATEATAQSSEAETVWHTVQRGETLAVIAQKYDTTSTEIAKANNLSNPNTISTGQKLKIPTSGESASTEDSSGQKDNSSSKPGCRYQHKVKRGDWVWQLARDYNVSPYDILKANNMTVKQANTIYPGQVLCIP
jgi:membrane-bound lytic murein transglycosylase D